jgi:hypothetical protein
MFRVVFALREIDKTAGVDREQLRYLKHAQPQHNATDWTTDPLAAHEFATLQDADAVITACAQHVAKAVTFPNSESGSYQAAGYRYSVLDADGVVQASTGIEVSHF